MSISDYNWESFNFPIKLTNISCEFEYHNFPSDSIIEIYRDEEFNFIGKIYGKTNNTKIAEYSHPFHQNVAGEFIEGENIVGYEINNNSKFQLQGCHVKNASFSPSGDTLLHSHFVIEIRMDFVIEINDSNEKETESLMEWFLTGRTTILFSRNTHYYDSERIKIRNGIDSAITSDASYKRMAWDFFLIELEKFSFIVQQVQNGIFPVWANGFIIEYRSSFSQIPSKEIRIAISEIVSFILGVEFIEIGYSEFNINNEVIRRLGNKPYGDNIISRCKRISMSPINYPTQYGRIDIESILNNLISAYLKLRDDFKFSTVLWKYWLARNSPVGINLPILSSAIEGLAESYLKFHNIIPKSN